MVYQQINNVNKRLNARVCVHVHEHYMFAITTFHDITRYNIAWHAITLHDITWDYNIAGRDITLHGVTR